jgi:hypothetical protein
VEEREVSDKKLKSSKKTRSKERKGRFGVIDREGKLLAPARWEYQESELDLDTTPTLRFNRDTAIGAPCFVQGAALFSEGLAAVRENYLWGYCDERGEVVVQPAYARAKPFRAGFAEVTSKGASGRAVRLPNPLKRR